MVGWKRYILSHILIVWGVMVALKQALLEVIHHPFLLFDYKRESKNNLSAPECLLDPILGKHQYVQANGIKFHYVTSGDPCNPLMLFLHGFPEFWYSWRHQIRAFCDNYHVVAVDLRGYNKTDHPPNTKDYFLPTLSQDIVKLIPALGHSKAILIAHDWGGVIAWAVAEWHPEVVEKLVVMNSPHPRVFEKEMKCFSKLMQKSWYLFFFQVPWLPEITISVGNYKLFDKFFRGGPHNRQPFTPEEIKAYKYVFSRKGALKYPLNYYRANVLRVGELFPSDGSSVITVPTLLIWGDKDACLDVAMADNHGDFVADLTVKHFRNCSHLVQNDSPDSVNRCMREFIENSD